MERRRPITDITDHPLVTERQRQVDLCLEALDETKRRLDSLEGKAASGDIEAIRQLETEGSQLRERIEEYTRNISSLITEPLP